MFNQCYKTVFSAIKGWESKTNGLGECHGITLWEKHPEWYPFLMKANFTALDYTYSMNSVCLILVPLLRVNFNLSIAFESRGSLNCKPVD